MHNVGDVDLNLLSVFDAVLRDRSVTLAASRLGLSQPAMSHALRRLRETFDDPLFVRTRAGMRPTPYAELLAPSVQRACEIVANMLQLDSGFVPARSRRVFTFYMSDIGEAVLLPKILARLRKLAPGVRVKVLRIPERSVQETMAAGEVDLAVGSFPTLTAGFYQQRLYRDEFVCLVRGNHPRIGSKLTPRQFSQLGHAVVHSANTGHEAVVQRAATQQGIKRVPALVVPHFLVLPMIVAETDLVATVPNRMAEAFGGLPNIRVMKPPMAIPRFEIKQHWHERYHHDAANRWLRGLIAELFLR